MGTRGIWGYRHKGQYYIIYTQWDSYPEELGKKLVTDVPSDPDEFEAWLAEKKLFLEQIEDVVDDDEDGDLPKVLSRSDYPPSTYVLIGDVMYTYLYDLDRMVFTMDEEVHLPLDDLPPWTPSVYRTPADARMSRVKRLSSDEMEDLALYEGVNAPEIIHASTWSGALPPFQGLSAAFKLAKDTLTGSISSTYWRISNIQRWFYQFEIEDIAKEVLGAAAPANSKYSEDFLVMKERVSQTNVGRVSRDSKTQRCNLFWFRGRLIVLAPTLTEEDRFKSKVGLVLRRAKEKGLRECTAILWSIHHVAVVVVSGEKVSHSEVFPVAAAYGMDEDKDKFEMGLDLITHYLAPPAWEADGSFDSRLPLDVFIRVMDFTDEDTSAMLGLTSKALRHEWLKHPWVGRYVIIGTTPDGGDGFLALDSESGRPFKIVLSPLKCLAYNDEDAYKKREEEVKHLLYRLPYYCVERGYLYYSSAAVREHGFEFTVLPMDDAPNVSVKA